MAEVHVPSQREDILAEDRALRGRFWWIGNWVGWRLVGLLALLLAAGVGGARYCSPDAEGPGRLPVSGASQAGPVQDLAPGGLRSVATRYGVPVGADSSGVPVILHRVTGDERPLTELEMSWDPNLSFTPTGYGNVVMAPGPRGLGVWWEDDSDLRVLNSYRAFSRSGWRDKQAGELSAVMARVSAALDSLSSLDGYGSGLVQGPVLESRVLEIFAPYGSFPDRYGWSAVPAQWRCQLELEIEMSQGVTPGCPSPELISILGFAWESVGLVAEYLDRASFIVGQLDRMSARERSQTMLVDELSFVVADMSEQIAVLESSLLLLHGRSVAEELPIVVYLEAP